MTVEEFCTDLNARLVALPSREAKLETAAKSLWQVFSVKTDEVAIYSLDKRFDSLQFLWPKKLQSAGSVPLTAHNSLVALTARERKCYLDNSFATTAHLFIFERFRLDLSGGVPIQKIMSAPMIAGDDVVGVVQVSRKGESRESSGEDFTPANLALLSRLAAIIVGIL